MFQIDMNYRQYADVLYAGRAAAQTASDMALLGLTAAGAVVDGSAVKSILSATATAVTGTRASVDSNLFKQQATEIFLNAMEDIRTQKRNIIQDKLQQSITDYSIYQAFVGSGGLLRRRHYKGRVPGPAAVFRSLEVRAETSPRRQRRLGQSLQRSKTD